MNNFTFYAPTRFVFGRDMENEAGRLVREAGGTKVLIHYGGGSAVRSGLIDRVKASLKKEGIQEVFGLVFTDNEAANAFWERQGYSLRTNLNYRNKSLDERIPTGE